MKFLTAVVLGVGLLTLSWYVAFELGIYSPPRPGYAEIIVASHDLAIGTTIQESDIEIRRIRPENLATRSPRRMSDLLGHKTRVAISKGTCIHREHLDPANQSSSLRPEYSCQFNSDRSDNCDGTQ
jgi:Flp pilus assembly protein CpaB